jgi:uncharacterized membrane protein YeaQ/YmgE (transglycosylase-associated protein family)
MRSHNLAATPGITSAQIRAGAPKMRGTNMLDHAEDSMLLDLIVWLIVGAVAGWLAGLIVKGYGFGLLWNIVIGIVGGLIAGWLLPRIGIFNIGGIAGDIVYSVIGAVILLLIVGFIKR